MNWRKSRLILVISCSITVLSLGCVVAQYIYFTRYAKGSQRVIRDRYNPQVMGKPLPDVKLVDVSGKVLQDDELRRGKVILVLLSSECTACFKDGQFLKAFIDKYSDVRFYGALLFWSDRTVNQIEDKFPMKLFFDQDSLLRRGLEVTSVPMKLYLEDGVVKKVWTGTPIEPQVEAAFKEDMEEISSR